MDGSVKSWDINKNWELGIYYKEDSDPVSSITYIPDFDMFATSHTLFIRLWKVNKEVFVKNESEYPVQQPSDLILIPIDSEKCKVMVSTEKGTILFFDYLILNGKAYIKSKKDPIQAHSKSIYKLLLIKKNNNVISCCKEENKLIVWNPLTMEKLQELIFNEGKTVKGIVYNENLNNFIITSGINKIWIMKQNENKLEIEGIIEKDENLLINEVSQLENKEFNLIITSACERKNSGKKGMENSYILKYIFV